MAPCGFIKTDVSGGRDAPTFRATCSAETSAYNKPTRRHIPEDGILYSHLRENLKCYNL
jgi:hypothetical protein